MADLLARRRQATYRFWREDVSARPGGAWADLCGVQVHTTGLPPRHWNGAFLARATAEAFDDPYELALAFVTPTLQPGARPPQRTLTAYDGAEPVGCATVAFLDDMAGVYGVAVRPAWRRRGIGAALTARCLRLARDHGCDAAYLSPSTMAYDVYAALGFEDALPFRVWVEPERRAPAP